MDFNILTQVDVGAKADLVVREDASDDDDHRQDDAEVKVIIWGFLEGRSLDGVGDEAEHRAKPQKHGKPTEQVLAEFHLE